MAEKKYRLVTRSDFDGLVCAVLLKEMDMLDSIKFVHPKDMQDGKVEITENDITTNLPKAAKAMSSAGRKWPKRWRKPCAWAACGPRITS